MFPACTIFTITFNVTVIDSYTMLPFYIDYFFRGGNIIVDPFFPPLRLKRTSCFSRQKPAILFLCLRRQETPNVKDTTVKFYIEYH